MRIEQRLCNAVFVRCCSGVAKTGYRSIYDLPHDFAGKDLLRVLGEVYQGDICRFRAMTLWPLHLVINWQVFTINICGFITKIPFSICVRKT